MKKLVKERLDEDVNNFTRGGDPYKKMSIGNRALYEKIISDHMGDQQAFDEAREETIQMANGFWKAEIYKDQFELHETLRWYEAGPYAFVAPDEIDEYDEEDIADFHTYEKGMKVMVINFSNDDGRNTLVLSPIGQYDGTLEMMEKWLAQFEETEEDLGENWTYSGTVYVDDFFEYMQKGWIKKI